jgi:hypothetical protein
VRATGGGPIRTIVEHAHAKPTGTFFSLKSGRSQPWEAIDERHYMWISEVDSRVRTYTAQPFRMEFVFDGGEIITYFPDLERILDDPTEVEVIEIKKNTAEASRDPSYAAKLSLARKACQAKGWNFRIIAADKHILPGHLLDNARLIRVDRLTRLTTEDHLRIGEAMTVSRGTLTYGDAVAALSGRADPWDRDATAKLHAMIARRFLTIDLTRRLTQMTSVRLLEQKY